MNVSQIKALTWLTAAGLGGALGWMIFDRLPQFRARLDPENAPVWADQERATRILHGVNVPEEAPLDLVPQARIQRNFLDLNWTGRAVQAPAPVVVEERPPEKPPAVPVSDLVRVLLIREEPATPERSRVSLIYKSASGVRAGAGARPAGGAPTPAGGRGGRGAQPAAPSPIGEGSGVDALRTYRTGDRLESPLDFVRIESIRAVEGVTFAFDDETRAHETLSLRDSGMVAGLIAAGSPETVLRPAPSGSIPMGDRRAAFSENTTRVGENMYRVGFEDIEHIGQNYPSIISSEISHRRYVDPRTKQPGILLTRVQPGGVAARHGLKEGDVIKSINGSPVGSPQEAVTYVKNNAESTTTWHVVIENMGQERTVVYESP